MSRVGRRGREGGGKRERGGRKEREEVREGGREREEVREGGREREEGRKGGREREAVRGETCIYTTVNSLLAAKKILFTYQQTPAHHTATENYPNLVITLLLFGTISIH